MAAPSGHLLQAGQQVGKTFADIVQRDAFEVTRRVQPETATHELYAAVLLESSYFLLAVIRSAACTVLKNENTASDFTDAIADTFRQSLIPQESEIFQAPGFEDRYFGTLDERLNEYGTTGLGQYDQYGLFQFAFAPDMPSTEPAFLKFIQHLSTATKESIDQPTQHLISSHLEEAMDALKLQEQLKTLG